MEVTEVVCSLAGRGREMLARGFALAFKGIKCCLKHSLSKACMPIVTLMISGIDRALPRRSTLCVLWRC